MLPGVRTPPRSATKSSAPKYATVTGGRNSSSTRATPAALSIPARTASPPHPAPASASATAPSCATDSSFGTTTPASPGGSASRTSSANHSVTTEFTRT